MTESHQSCARSHTPSPFRPIARRLTEIHAEQHWSSPLRRHLMGRLFRRFSIILAVAGTVTLAGSVQAVAAPAAYTALGDSYSSGVGSRTYYADSGSCYRSPLAYPVLTAGRVGANLTFAACSGARVADVQNNQLGSLSAGTSLVTITIGGNDAGFVSVIQSCARPWPWTWWGDINNANTFIRGTLPGRLDGLYDQIRGRAP